MTPVSIDLTFEVVYPYARTTVWAALTDAKALAAWLLENDFEPRVGKVFTLRSPDMGVVTCTVLVLDAPRYMEWSWQHPDLQIPTTVVFTLDEVEGGTRLTVQHRGPTQVEYRADITAGWPRKLARLLTWLAAAAALAARQVR